MSINDNRRGSWDAALGVLGLLCVAIMAIVVILHNRVAPTPQHPSVASASASIAASGVRVGASYVGAPAVLDFGPEPLRLDMCATAVSARVGPCMIHADGDIWSYLADDVAPGGEVIVPACATEDSVACVWDPATMGNRASGEHGNKVLLVGSRTTQE